MKRQLMLVVALFAVLPAHVRADVVIDTFSNGSGETAPGESAPDTLVALGGLSSASSESNPFNPVTGVPGGVRWYQTLTNNGISGTTSTMALNLGTGSLDFSTSTNNATRWVLAYGFGTFLDFDLSPGAEDTLRIEILNQNSGIQLTSITMSTSGTNHGVTLNQPLNASFIDVPFSAFSAPGTFNPNDMDQILIQFDTGVSFTGGSASIAAVLSVAPIPEPASLALLGLTAVGAGIYRWRRRRAG